MKKLLYALTLLTIVSCSTSPKVDYPYSKINAKTETAGNNTNTMELYTTPETMNLDTLKMFCKEKKDNMSTGAFHYLVFFDSKDNAVFPNNPMTAFYGIEEEPQKHIRAYFVYNRLNGYSKLNVYETNSWESKASTFDI
jgi:cephalosporin-C deacetylase-like acetyl esterase